jgi:hypothetical protein
VLAWLLLHIKATQKLADSAIPTLLELKVNLMPLKMKVIAILQCHLNPNDSKGNIPSMHLHTDRRH